MPTVNDAKNLAPYAGCCLVGFVASEWVTKEKGTATKLLAAFGFGLGALLVGKGLKVI